jgi:hypothetical protein
LDVACGVVDGKGGREVAPLCPAGGGDVVAHPAAGDACAGGSPAWARAVEEVVGHGAFKREVILAWEGGVDRAVAPLAGSGGLDAERCSNDELQYWLARKAPRPLGEGQRRRRRRLVPSCRMQWEAWGGRRGVSSSALAGCTPEGPGPGVAQSGD